MTAAVVPTPVRRPRVLFIGPLPEPVTGHSLACQVLLDALRLSVETTVVNLSKTSMRGGVSSMGRIGEVLRILWLVMRGVRGTDVVYLTISESVAGNMKDLLIYAICWGHLDRMVIHLHGGSIRAHIFDRHPTLRRWNRFFLRRIGCAVVLGESHRRVFDGMTSPDRVHVVPNFAEDYLFADASEIERKFSAAGPIHLLFLSNLIEGKGHADLVRGYQLLDASQRDRFRLHFAGAFESGAVADAFTALVAGDAGITYHGVVRGEAKRQLLGMSHLLVLPTSLSEGQPISILEAYASGCVVMTTACGGIPDVFEDGVNGFGITPGEPLSIRDALRRVLDERATLVAVALSNQRTAQTAYRTDRYATRLGALLTMCAVRPGAAGAAETGLL
jgi:glycosyltransferase involved in cell wall biosynthesis